MAAEGDTPTDLVLPLVIPPPAVDVRRTLLDEVAVLRFLRSANDKGIIDGATGIKLLAYLQDWERGS